MLHVDLLRRTPFGMCRLEGVFGANDFTLETCRQGGMVIGETWAM